MKINYGITAGLIAALITGFSGFAVYSDAKSCLDPKETAPLSDIQQKELDLTLDTLYPERNDILTSLPYSLKQPDIFINAQSAILIDTLTGSVLFEKNADQPIPPASMTKLVEMYVVFEAVANGEVSLDDEVPLPKQSWAINLPSDASIMFLAQGQHVTLRELLLGLAIASGNDASIAVAYYICGNMEDFVKRMNDVIASMGLKNTHFVESSGYSEKNVTTARDFASFARMYVNRFPEAITDYHSKKVLKYPLEKNLPDSQKSQGDGQAVIQYNTNKLLSSLEGCDGLKTGFIYESGYNITLTAQRNGFRLLSVTMKGPGRGSVQGNKYRTQDGTNLMEYGFSNFFDYTSTLHSFKTGVLGGNTKTVNLIPSRSEAFTVPYISGESPADAASRVKVKAFVPDYIYGEVKCGQQYGTITYSIDDKILQTLSLVADRDSEKQKGLKSLEARLIDYLLRMYR